MATSLFRLGQPSPAATSQGILSRLCMTKLDSRGLEWRSLARRHGLDTARLQAPHPRVLVRSETAFVREAMHLAGDPDLCWSLGAWDLRDFGLHGYTMLNQPDLRGALRYLLWFGRSHTEGLDLDLVEANGEATLVDTITPLPITSEFLLHLMLSVLRQLAGPDFQPLRAATHQTDPNRLRLLSDRIGRPVEGFPAPLTFISFPSHLLDRPITGADGDLADVLHGLGTQTAAEVAERRAELHELRSAVLALLPSGTPTAARVADALGITLGTLQERLGRLGVRLPRLVDAIRADLGRQMLAMPHMTLTRAARALGYARPRTLARAHNRWWGTPLRDGRKGDVRAGALRPEPTH